MRRFYLRRLEDETGISGTGLVTRGIQFSDGTVVMQWLTDTSSLCLYSSIEDVITIHGHGGKTVVVSAEDEDFDVFMPGLLGSEALRYLVDKEAELG